MSERWDNELFEQFVRLRDDLRAAKRVKDYQQVQQLGLNILELNKRAGFIKIFTPIFLKHIADASMRLNDSTTAIKYLKAAREAFKERQLSPDDWQKDIAMIDRKLEKLESNQLKCPDCGNEITDTRGGVQPYNDFDDYLGFRCVKCKRTFADEEIEKIAGK